MNVKDVLVFIPIVLLAKLCAATDKHCHNETGRCYWLGTGSKTWDSARTACQSQGGDLAVIETEELHNFVSNLFKARYFHFLLFFFSISIPRVRHSER